MGVVRRGGGVGVVRVGEGFEGSGVRSIAVLMY